MGLSKNTITVKDGALGSGGGYASNAFAIIGISEKIPSGIITISSISEIEDMIGEGQLRDFLVDAFSFKTPPVAYVKVIAGSVIGTKSAITKTGTGKGTFTIAGDPRNQYKIKITIISAGGLNVATFQAEVDGRLLPKATVPALGTGYTLGNTGLTLNFDDGNPQIGETAFVSGDTFEFTTTAPSATNEELLNAIDEVFEAKKSFRLLCVALETDKVFWSVFQSRIEAETDKNFFCRGLTFGRDINESETRDQYITKMTTPEQERGMVEGKRIQVVLSVCSIVDAINGNTDYRTVMGKYLGFLMQNKIYESPAKTLLGAVGGIEAIKKYLESGEEKSFSLDGHIKALDKAGFVTVRTYHEKAGIYFTSGRTLCDEGSDFGEIMNCFVMDKACTVVAKRLFNFFNKDEDIGSDGTILGLSYIKAYGQQPLDDMKYINNEISSGTFIVPKEQDLLKTKNLNYFVEIVPKGYIVTLTGTINFVNPYVNK
ncbi:MAG: hypothetical protein A2Y41_07865 [Spirochaetes bacterium GWB1_36_13]|nr:MAG: hypothetical protein A2Y41_07865 [Spirochaetes bacterium GWB1_36_13]